VTASKLILATNKEVLNRPQQTIMIWDVKSLTMVQKFDVINTDPLQKQLPVGLSPLVNG
jgi:hypothetical protein